MFGATQGHQKNICDKIEKPYIFIIVVKDFTQLFPCNLSPKKYFIICPFAIEILIDPAEIKVVLHSY